MYEYELMVMGRTGARVGRHAQVMAIPPCSVDHNITFEKLTKTVQISFCRLQNEI